MKTTYIKLIYFTLIFCGIIICGANYCSAAEIIARVNDKIITNIDFEQNMQILKQSEGKVFETKEAKNQHLNTMINNMLLAEFCEKQRMTINEAEVTAIMERMAAQNNLTLPEFYQMIRREGMSVNAFTKHVGMQLLLTSFENTFLLPKIEVSTKDLNINRKRVIQDIIAKSKQIDSVKVQEIIAECQKMSDAEFKNLASNINEIIAAEGFYAAAKQFSHVASKENGGEIGWIAFKDASPVYQTLLRDSLRDSTPKMFINQNAILVVNASDAKYSYGKTKQNITDDEIIHFLKQERLGAKTDEFIKNLRRKAFVVVNF